MDDLEIDPLDRVVHGALGVAKVLDLRGRDGKLSRNRAYYLLEGGHVDADRLGKRQWMSTPRRLLRIPRS
jgi:hypothetical protein